MDYVAADRSILLPAYKRFVVDPVLPFLPRSLHPNVITHAGHLINLLGAALVVALRPRDGWALVVAMVSLQLYNFCDNADGGHARRTQQCSPLGELLDHGLDMLNIVYIACVAAIAIGAPPIGWVAISIVLPAACAATYWEQAETGVFSLGALNQIESVMLLSVVLVISAIFGVDVWERIAVGPVTARLVMLGFVGGTAAFGIVKNLYRVVKRRGVAALARGGPHVAFAVAIFAAALVGALSAPAAIAVSSAGSLFFGVRSLAMRTAGEAPRIEPGLVGSAALAVGLVLFPRAGLEVVVVAAALVFFGTFAAINARSAYRDVLRA